MPYARIEIPADWSLCPRPQLLQAVDAAFVTALGVPPRDAFLRLFEYAPADALIPAWHGAHFIFIEIQLFAGRSLEAKRSLYRALVEQLAALGIPGNDVSIALVEIPQQNWGLRGGQPGSELDHGFVIER